MQVNWTKEKALPPKLRTYDEAMEVIMGGVKKSLNEFWKNIPDEWKQTIVPDNQDVLSNNWTPTL